MGHRRSHAVFQPAEYRQRSSDQSDNGPKRRTLQSRRYGQCLHHTLRKDAEAAPGGTVLTSDFGIDLKTTADVVSGLILKKVPVTVCWGRRPIHPLYQTYPADFTMGENYRKLKTRYGGKLETPHNAFDEYLNGVGDIQRRVLCDRNLMKLILRQLSEPYC